MPKVILLSAMSSSASSNSESDSDSSSDSTFSTRQRKPGPKKYECKGCSKVFRNLASRFVHTSKCEAFQKRKNERTCSLCSKTFPSKSALAIHAVEVHGDSNKDIIVEHNNPFTHACEICKMEFKTNIQLKYHIRRVHFNLIGKVPYAHEKKVNQVWFEKVMNSNNIVEIKKTNHNILVMKKINENTAINVNNDNERIIDVSHLYPTGRQDMKIKCKDCNKMLQSSRYPVHYREVHLNIRNYHCDICNKSFKRRYMLQSHTCFKAQKLKSDSDAGDDITCVKEPSKA